MATMDEAKKKIKERTEKEKEQSQAEKEAGPRLRVTSKEQRRTEFVPIAQRSREQCTG